MPAGRSAPGRSRWRLFATRESRYVAIAAVVIAIVAILIGGHLHGMYLASRDLGGRDTVIARLQAETQQQKRKIDEQIAQLTALQIKLTNVQAQLEAIMPSANTYNIDPNHALIVADGHLTIALIGSPGNEGVTLDINGKQQTVAAGQVVGVAPDPSISCQVAVQSFDMFKAVLTASCTGAKPH
jgi:hypothetical protein